MPVAQFKCKGVDNRSPFFGSALGYAQNVDNCRLYNGAFQFIYGKFKLNASALNSGAVIRGATTWYDPANAYEAIVAVAGSKIYTAQWSSDIATLTFTDRTGAVTITNSNFKTFTSLNNLLIIAGGSASGDVLLKMTTTTGNAVILAGTPPLGDCVCVVNNYLFVGRQMNAAGTKSRVTWSAVNDPETWAAADFVDFRKNDGDEVTALAAIGTDLLIFKNKSIGRLSTTGISISGTYTLGPLVTVSDRIGTPSALAVDTMPDGTVVFLGGDGNLYRCDGNQVVKLNEKPLPSSNYNFIATSFDPVTLSTYYLKVYPTYNEIRIKGGAIYNYLDNYWYRDTTNATENVLFVSDFRRTGGFWNAYTLCCGTNDGFIVAYDNANYQFPTDINSNPTTAGFTAVFNLKDLGFVPRFMKVYHYNCTPPASVVMSIGWQAGASTNVTRPGDGFANAAMLLPIPQRKDTSNMPPDFLSITFNNIWSGGSTGGFVIYLMDEEQ